MIVFVAQPNPNTHIAGRSQVASASDAPPSRHRAGLGRGGWCAGVFVVHRAATFLVARSGGGSCSLCARGGRLRGRRRRELWRVAALSQWLRLAGRLRVLEARELPP